MNSIIEKINLFNYSKDFVKTGRVVIDLTETSTPYKYVAFNEGEDIIYWIAAYDWDKSKMSGYQNCPHGGFKTANGCKKNFLKHMLD